MSDFKKQTADRLWIFFYTVCLFLVQLPFLTASVNQDFYSFVALDAHGRWIHMDKYRGKVLLVVNVASECGYTDGHYKDLVKLQHDLGSNGNFYVLAFPCNQFGGQEPKDSPEILHFASEKYAVNFPVFHKINVINSDIPDLWKYLEEKSGKVPTWNFWKYLIDSKGAIVDAWGPWIEIKEIYSKIKEAVTVAEQNVKSSSRDHQDL